MQVPLGSASYDVNYIATVLEITPTCARCRTFDGSEVLVEWNNNLPDETPSVGEVWALKLSEGVSWSFENRIGSGEYNVIRYAMLADARDCIGKDRSIIDDIAAIGLDEVYLVCGSGGVALWQSSVAEKYGIKVFSDYVSPVVSRLWYANIPVTLVIENDIFGTGSGYNQVDSGGNVHTAMSYSAARFAVAEMVAELYSIYGSKNVRGICFSGFGEYDFSCDFNIAAVNNFFDAYGRLPGAVEYGDDEWLGFLGNEQADFLSIVAASAGGWPISAIVDGTLVDYSTSYYTGGAGIGLNDDFGTYGWASVGVPLMYRQRSDMSLRLRSLEYVTAYAVRFARGASPLFMLDLDMVSDFATVMNMMAKYEASTVLFADYRKFRAMNDAEVLSMKSAMGRFRVTEKSLIQSIGLAVSSASMRSADTVSGNKEWVGCVEDIAVEILDKLPHKLSVMFDSDLETPDYSVSAVVLPNPTVLSDDAIAVIADSSLPYVICGGNDSLYSVFGQRAGQETEYGGGLFLGGGTIDAVDDDYFTSSSGSRPLISETGFAVDGDGNQVPIFMNGRTSFVALDVAGDPVLISLVGDLALYAVGR